MASVPVPAPSLLPTNVVPLARLFAYTQSLGLERYLARAKRGLPTLVLSLLWLTLAWRGTGRPHHLGLLAEPLLAALLGLRRLPTPRTLSRSLAYFPAQALRAAVEASYLAELPHRSGRIWAALDAHHLPYWGRGKTAQFTTGWAGALNRCLRGYRLYLAVDTETGQIITFVLLRGDARDHRLTAALARRVRRVLGRRLAGVVADCGFTSRAAVAALLDARVPFILGFARTAPVRAQLAALSGQQRRWLRDGGAIRLGLCAWDGRLQLLALAARSPIDRRGPWVYVTNVQGLGPRRLMALYRRRWRVEQVLDELVHGHDLDHLVSYRLHPNRIAVGFRLLARNLAIGLQIREAGGRPAVIREPLAFRTAHVDGLGTFVVQRHTILLTPCQPAPAQTWRLPWSQRTVRLAA
jgi:Transposase DDE domain